jgi:hypothetical protein
MPLFRFDMRSRADYWYYALFNVYMREVSYRKGFGADYQPNARSMILGDLPYPSLPVRELVTDPNRRAGKLRSLSTWRKDWLN